MMNMKKLLALLLAIVMVVGMFPMGAVADETEPSIPETTGEAAVIDVDPCAVCGEEGCTATHVQCVTCGTWDCATNHETTPATTEPSVPETTAPATTEPSVPETTAPVEKCALCESTEHATNLCTLFCGFCQKVPCVCVTCDECGMKNDHTSACPKKPCADCGKSPCECEAEETTVPTTEAVEVCEFCGVELTEDVEHEAGCLSLCICNPKPEAGGVHEEDCPLHEEVEEVEEEEELIFEDQDESVFQVEITNGRAGAIGFIWGRNNTITSSVASGAEVYALQGVPVTNARYETNWSGLFHIEAEGETVVTMSNIPGVENRTVEVRHYFDSADAVSAAIANGTAKFYTEEGISKYLPNETAAVLEVDPSRVDTICYEILSTEKETVIVNDSNSISFATDSFSLFEVNVLYETPIEFTVAAPILDNSSVSNEGLESSKSIIYNEDTDSYTLLLESYVTGSSTEITTVSTKATDFVISLDTSHSMDECINCGGADTDSVSTGNVGKYTRCKIYASELDLNTTYYRGTSSSDPVNYCADCKGWFASSHWKADGTHGSIDDVRYLPWESASSKDKTIARIGNGTFYEEHICTDDCAELCELAGTRVPAYSLDPDFSTNKTYYTDADVTHTAAKYVITYCGICAKWVSGYHCSGGDVRDPASVKFYENHECTGNCAAECDLAGTRVLVDVADISTEKEYFRSNNVKNTSATYVIKFCPMCERWISNTHGHNASTGTTKIPYERGTYGKTVYDLFHVPCISLLRGAKTAIQAFIDEIYEKSKGPDGIVGTDDDVHHRIALTGFSGEPTNGRIAIDYRPYKGSNDSEKSDGNTSWSRSGIYSVWNPNIEEAKSWYPYITDFDGRIAQQNFVSYDNIDSSTRKVELKRAEYFYTHALRDVTSEVERDVLAEGMKDYNYEYGTETQEGIIMADNIFKRNYDSNRNRVLVLFTDGEPTSANSALAAVNNIKNNNTYEATVYGIGTFANASAEDIFPLPSLSTNKFLTLMSSNYLSNSTTSKNAAGKTYSESDINPVLWLKDDEGEYATNADNKRVFNVWETDNNYEYILDASGKKIPRKDKGAYYLTADDGDSLVKAFQSVANTSTVGGAQIELNSETVTQDVMSANWIIESVYNGRQIEAYTMTYQGKNAETGLKQWKRMPEGEVENLTVTTTPVKVKETVIENGIGVEKEVERDAVQVTGFNYSEHYVGVDKKTDSSGTTSTPRGKKLVIEIPVKPSANNKGGEAQFTNDVTKSGIMADNTFIENFDSPRVDMPVDVSFQKILVNGNLDQSFDFAMNWISFDHYSNEGNVPGNRNYLQAVGKDENRTLNTKSGVTTPLKNLVAGSAMTITEQSNENYLVEVSLDGGKTFLAAPQEEGFVTDAVIEEEEEVPEESVPEGSIPEDIERDDEETGGGGSNEGGSNEGGSGEGGSGEGGEEEPAEPEYSLKLIRNADGSVTAEFHVSEETAIVFRNTLLITDLTITKNLESAAMENQAFLFHLQGSDDNTVEYAVDVVVTVTEGETVGTATIKDVLIGEYTVVENQDWAWRYELATGSTATVTKTVSGNAEENVFAFTNVRNMPYWLSGDSYCENWWQSASNIVKRDKDNELIN